MPPRSPAARCAAPDPAAGPRSAASGGPGTGRPRRAGASARGSIRHTGRVIEVETARRVEKPWGHELWFAHTERYAGKLLHVNAGHRLSVQYHEHKDETSYVLAGRLILSQGTDAQALSEREVGPGDVWRNEPRV